MAVVKIWKVESNLGQVVDYAENEEKTDLANFKDLESVIDYAENGDKTEETLFVSGINCDPKNAKKEMMKIKKKFVKTDGVLAWHAYQSFKEGEVTPDEAHKIGLELAKEMWGDRFQVVVTTHLNTSHIHNHFVVNSVSFIDGKKYNADRSSYAEFRRLNDLICMEHGKSFLQEKRTKSGINYLNYQNRNITYTNYYKKAKEDLDFAIAISNSYDEFKRTLSNIGYEITVRAEKLSIRGKDYKRNIRIERYFGEDYSIENIKKQILGLYLPEKKVYYRNHKPKESLLCVLSKPKYNSFYSMYIRYCNILNNYPNYVKKYNVSSTMKADLDKLELLSVQARLLVENNIETEEQFKSFLENKIDEVDDKKSKRTQLYKLMSDVETVKEKLEIRKEINNLGEEIKSISFDIDMLEMIKSRTENIKEEIQKLEDKEMMKDEHIK